MSKYSNEITLGGLFLEFFDVAGETLENYRNAKNEEERAKIRQEIHDVGHDILNTIQEETEEVSSYITKRLKELEEDDDDFAVYFDDFCPQAYQNEKDTFMDETPIYLQAKNEDLCAIDVAKKNFAHKEPHLGDHIRVKRLGGLYYHHGIYIGNNAVIHFAPPCGGEIINWNEAIVREDSLEDFLKNGEIEVRQYSDDELLDLYSPSQIVKNAKKCLGFRNYNLLFNNCEHFAYSCTTGTKQSPQVKEFFSTLVDIIN